MSEEVKNWKKFQGTALGSLMNQIYGNENKPMVSYPKPKQKSFAPQQKFIPGGNKASASDPRSSTRTEGVVTVPIMSKKRVKYHAVDFIPHRRNGDAIKEEIADIKMRQEYYRPAHSHAISSDSEKQRLSNICQYKGGKGLPQELLHPVGDTPLEIDRREKEKKRIQEVRTKKLALSGAAVLRSNTAPKPILSADEQMAEQLSEEINERSDYLREMKELNGGRIDRAIEGRLKREISDRTAKLKRLDKR